MQNKYVEDQYYIGVFESKSHAVYLYQHLQKKGLRQFELISTPCKIKAGCSYSIKFLSLDLYDLLKAEAEAFHMKIASVYVAERINKKKSVRKLF